MYYQNYNNRGNGLWVFLILFSFLGGFRLFFVIFGLALAIIINFFPFILAGSIIYMISKKMRKNNTVSDTLNTHTKDHKRFVELTIHLIVRLIKEDGKVDERELQALRSFFQIHMRFNPSQMIWVEDIVQDSLKKDYTLKELCGEFHTQFKGTEKLMLLQLLYQVALADGQFHSKEDRLIHSIAEYLYISHSEHQQVRALFIKEDDKTFYYQLLELNPPSTKEEIKKAYRQASKKYHPDTVHHLGDEFKKVAEEKMQKINEAYTALSKG